MAKFKTIYTIPSGSMALITDEAEQDRYIDAFSALPRTLLPVVNDPKVGAWLRGLTATHNLPPDKTPTIARMVLEVVTGMLATTEMARTLTQRLGVDAKVGENIAREIEKELLAPVALELNQYLQSRAGSNVSLKDTTGGSFGSAPAKTAGMQDDTINNDDLAL